MTPGVLEVTDLSFRYPGATEDTLRNVTLRVDRGDFVAVVGGNGSGKTTLCKTFNGLVPHYWNGEFAGAVTVDGVDTYESDVSTLSRTVGFVYQDFQNQLVRPTVRDEVAFAPLNYGMPDHEERATEALNRLGIEGLADRFVWQLSGGQAHLVALAAVLAMRPSVLVVDEPVAEVDPARAHDLYRRLSELNDDGITVVTIEHHAEFVAEYARSVVLMAGGAPVWHLPVDEALARTSELEAHGIPSPQVVRACAALGVVPPPRTIAAAVATLADRPVRSLSTPPAPSGPSPGAGADVVARVAGVYHGHRSVDGSITPVLRDLDVELHRRERVALVGGNGAGKSTLLRLLAGIDVAREGTVEVDGVDTREVSAAEMAGRVAYLYQRPERMFLRDSVRGDALLFPASRGVHEAESLVDEVLARVRLTEHASRDGRMLSGGQQRRATLAIGLAMRPSLLLLDEPTSSLDVESRTEVTSMLEELSDVIACAVVATHDMHLVAEWADRVLVLHGGRVEADLAPRELFARPDLLDAAHLVPPQVTRLGLELGLDPLPLGVSELVWALGGGPVAAVGATPVGAPAGDAAVGAPR